MVTIVSIYITPPKRCLYSIPPSSQECSFPLGMCKERLWVEILKGSYIHFDWLIEYNNIMNGGNDFYDCLQVTQLNALITMLIGKLSEGDRQKIMTICTIEVHNRDVVSKLIGQKVENSQAFTWLSQLRHRWDDKEKDCFANICDAQFRYSHEYLGNTPRLVITPLTDRFRRILLKLIIVDYWLTIINHIQYYASLWRYWLSF